MMRSPSKVYSDALKRSLIKLSREADAALQYGIRGVLYLKMAEIQRVKPQIQELSKRK